MINSGVFILKELWKVNNNTQKNKAHPNIRFFRDYGAHDSYVAAEKISAPVLIIQGSKDKIVPLAKSQELKKRIRNSQIKVIIGADHKYTTTQKPLIKEIMKFVKDQKSRIIKK
jgi:pimeloyl-ACP methyl ester carboxylesterase